MNKLPNPEDILKFTWRIGMDCPDGEYDAIEAMKEYGRSIRDSTLEWAAHNSTLISYRYDIKGNKIKPTDLGEEIEENGWYISTNKESILKGKTSKNLEI